MSFHSRILLSCLMLLGASHVYAQSQMTIDGNCSFPLASSGTSVSINPTSGNVTVTSQSGANCSTASVTLSLPASAQVSTTFNVSWTSIGTTSCTPSGGGGSNWSSQGTLPTSGNRTITAPASAASNVVFTINCATGGTPVSDSKTMNFTGGGGSASVNLVAPSSTPVSQNFTISWTSSGTSGTTPCTPSGGGSTNWSSQGALEPNGQRTISAPAAAGSAVFSISCATASTPVSDSETVNFTGDSVNCTGVTAPPGISPGAPQNWASLYSGGVFPLPVQTLADIPMTPGASRVIRIVPQLTANPSQNVGSLVYTSFQNANVVASISPCPNDFREGVLNTATQRCFRPASEQVDLAYRMTGFAPLFCNLTPGQTYYINLHVGTGSTPDATGAFCASGTCIYRGGTQAGLSTAAEPTED